MSLEKKIEQMKKDNRRMAVILRRVEKLRAELDKLELEAQEISDRWQHIPGRSEG